MRVDKPAQKDALNRQKHKVGFALADVIFADPFALTVYDRHEGGEHRWHTFGMIAGTIFLVVHSFPDPEDEDWVRVISLRKATAFERRQYEENEPDQGRRPDR